MSLTHSVEGGLFCKKGSATISFYDKELDKTYKVKVKDLLGKNKDAFDSVTKMTVYPNGDKSDHFDMLKIVVVMLFTKPRLNFFPKLCNTYTTDPYGRSCLQ
ncbi:unnamed protein product [Heligmosomoides polygyrus]|uniref:Lipocln_cytosolic_FA-bd_dom domain-containing protein n=1 Tax=Heligmosomoides polygyrus TaxID=6339 RepID=A0A183F801_HELPZ|nr:unnamed protein product [Heligmosomoides polygyrus]